MQEDRALFELELTRGAKTIPATRKNLMGTINSPSHNQAIAMGRATTDEELKQKLKIGLAGAVIHTKSCKDGKRSEANVEEDSIFVGVDIDKVKEQGVADIREYFVKHILPIKDEIHLIWSYITYSDNGFRLIVRRPSNATIEETQKWVALKVKLKHDTKCKDKARLFFLPGMDDILYMDEKALFGEKELAAYTIAPLALTENEEIKVEDVEVVDVENLECFGIKLVNLIERIVVMVAKHSLPLVEGERNDIILKAVRKTLAVESAPNVLVSLFVNFGLGKEEVTRIVNSALRYQVEGEAIYADVRNLIRELRAEAGLITGDGLLPCRPLPKKLPIGISEWVAVAPEGFAPAVIIAFLPLAGTIATLLRFDYLDGNEHSPSFMSHIVGEFASGKSFLKVLAACFLSRIRTRDAAARALEDEYRRKLKQCKNDTKLPEDPRPVVIEVPFNISTAKLLKRMAQAKGRHLVKVAEEIDTSTKANKAGAWSEHSDIDRYSFDNALYGKDNMNEDTYSGIVPVYCNSITTGTYKATKRHYEHHVEDGLVSRTVFGQLPSNFAGKMPVFKKFTAKQLENIERAIDLLEQAEGKIKLPKTLKAIDAWLDEKRQLANETQSNAINSFFRRAAVIAARGAAVFSVLYGNKEPRTLIDFALWLADYTLQQQVALWGSYVENQEEVKVTPLANLYQDLPEKFSREELRNFRIMNGMPENPRMNIKRWKDAGMIREVEKGQYVKTTPQAKA